MINAAGMRGMMDDELMTPGEYIKFCLSGKRRGSEEIAREVGRRVKLEKGVVLEVGCGPGFLIAELANLLRPGVLPVGADIDPEMLEFARDYFKGGSSVPSLVRNGMEGLPFKNCTADIVVSEHSLHHWADPGKMILEITRVLKPGGTALIYDINRGSIFTFAVRSLYLALRFAGYGKVEHDAFIISASKGQNPGSLAKMLDGLGIAGWRITKKRVNLLLEIRKSA